MFERVSEEFQVIEDFQGKKIKLYDFTVEHIKQSHPDVPDPVNFVSDILKSPILITEDELPNTVIYHKRARKPLVHVAYVEVDKGRVKSAHISDKIKGGNILWFIDSKDLMR
jgi:hypothetical protein